MIELKNKMINNKKTSICVPIVSENLEGLKIDANSKDIEKCDVVEWRADYINDILDNNILFDCISNIRKIINNKPLIFTLRDIREGGKINLTREERLAIIMNVIQSREVDFVDIELFNDNDFIRTIRSECNKNNVYLILSNHDFEKTPSEKKILNTLIDMNEKGCAIAKIAYTPVTKEDVLNQMMATYKYNEIYNEDPVISISMGKYGLITRACAGFMDSCITFASGKIASASGQINIDDLKKVVEILENE